jgi:broad specificity phosphatase PhoE
MRFPFAGHGYTMPRAMSGPEGNAINDRRLGLLTTGGGHASATEILLLRHGESEGNQQGRFGGHGPTPLTALGRRQAETTARVLALEGRVAAIYSSDLPRAAETAAPLAELTGIASACTAALRERSVGAFTGLTFAEAEAAYPEAYGALMRREPDAYPPGGETSASCLDRAATVLDEALARYAGGRVVMVSHAYTINLILRRVMGVADPRVPLFFQTDNCALHRLRRSAGGTWTIAALNDRRHLAGM